MSRAGASISAVVTTCHRPDELRRALLSVLNQTEPPVDVIVSQDGPADADTASVIRELQPMHPQTPLRLVRPRDDRGAYRGVGASRNTGVSHAAGAWIAFLDDDDEWLPAKLAMQKRHLDGVALVGCNALRRSSGKIYFPGHADCLVITQSEIARHNPLITSGVLLRKDLLLQAGGFSEDFEIQGVEDYDAWLRIHALDTSVLRLPDALLIYDDSGSGRLSCDTRRMERRALHLQWKHFGCKPFRRASALPILGGRTALAYGMPAGISERIRIAVRRCTGSLNRC
jgi:GT2 family glycosyltransferase